MRPYFLEPDAGSHNVYLIGFDETVDAMRTYKVERIRTSTVTADRYEIPEDFDPDAWLAHSWGIWSAESGVDEVVLRFDPSVAQRVRESVWHRSQRLTELDDGRIELAVTVAGIVEIRPWILSWGDAVEVVAPRPCARRWQAWCNAPPTATRAEALEIDRTITPRRLAELAAVGIGLAVLFYVGWDGALWDPRYQLGLHLAAVAVVGGLLWVAERRRPAAHAAGDPDPGAASGLRDRQPDRLEFRASQPARWPRSLAWP